MNSGEKGALVCRSKPFVFVIADKSKGRYCDFCVKRNNDFRKCNRCSYMSYCNRSCQKKAWGAGHKHECLNIKHFKDANSQKSPEDNVVLFSRAIYKLKFGGNEQEEEVCAVTRRFQDLESHVDNIRKDANRLQDFNKIVEGLENLLPPDDLPPHNELLEIYGKVRINGDVVRNDYYDIIGGAIYLGTSIFNHSCRPNAVSVSDGVEKCVYLIEDIPDFDHSKIFVSYIGLQLTTEERRDALKMMYYFDCNCVRCLDEHGDQLLDSIKCFNPQCEAPVIIGSGPTSCSKCRTTIYKQRIKSALAAMDLCKKSYPRLDPKMNFKCFRLLYTIKECEKILKIAEPLLHPGNIHLFRIAKIACPLVYKFDELQRAFQLIDNIVLPFMKKTENNYRPKTGFFLLRMLERARLIGDDFLIKRYLKEVFEIFAVTRGISREVLLPYRELMAKVDSSFDPNFSD